MRKNCQDKKELKQLVINMAQYIDSFENVGTFLLSHAPKSFDPNSSNSQQLVKQIKRGRLLLEAMNGWWSLFFPMAISFLLFHY